MQSNPKQDVIYNLARPIEELAETLKKTNVENRNNGRKQKKSLGNSLRN